MKIVHGFLCGLLPVGVRVPVLSVAGDKIPSSGPPPLPSPTSGVFFPDFAAEGLITSSSRPSGGAGLASPLPSPSLPAAASRSARSCCFLSFFRSRFARSFSAFSADFSAEPFVLSFGVSRPDDGGGGLVGFDLGAGMR